MFTPSLLKITGSALPISPSIIDQGSWSLVLFHYMCAKIESTNKHDKCKCWILFKCVCRVYATNWKFPNLNNTLQFFFSNFITHLLSLPLDSAWKMHSNGYKQVWCKSSSYHNGAVDFLKILPKFIFLYTPVCNHHTTRWHKWL